MSAVTLSAALSTCKLDTLLHSTNEAAPGAPKDDPAAGIVVVIANGDLQTDTVDALLERPLMVRVRDLAGHPVPEADVLWTVMTGDGALVSSDWETDANGEASASYRLGEVAGPETIRVSVSGTTAVVTFTVTTLPGAAARVDFLQQPSDIEENEIITPPVVVTVTDRVGNPAVTFAGEATVSLSSRWASLTGTRTRPVVQGIATFDDLKVNRHGDYKLRAVAATRSAMSESFSVERD